MKVVECVPNFSEGRNKEVIDAIAKAISDTPGVTLLDVDPGAATNRTVYTFAGDPEAVLEAAFNAIKVGVELIDMRKHKGEHPRMGACDVCPFVPVAGVTMDECVELAKRLGKRVGEELGIPVYLYEYAATAPHRKNLADIRAGEYEGLPEKIKQPEWRPDFGPAQFIPKSGATVIGARDFLIAYNINFNTKDKRLVKEIALEIREKGRILRDEHGKKVRGPDGKFLRKPGKFKYVKATSWYIEEYGCAQLTMNLTNYKVTPPHIVFDEVCKMAYDMGLRVTGSEIVGLVPLEAMLMAGEYFLKKQGAYLGVSERELVEVAIRSLGLNDVAPFEPEKKIIEYRLFGSGGKLMNQKVWEFCETLASDAPAPGGGSVSALSASMSAALTSMVGALTYKKKGYEEHWEEMNNVGKQAQALRKELQLAVDKDTEAFNKVMAAYSMPKKTDEEKEARKKAIEEANKEATLVPLSVLEKTPQLLELAKQVILHGNQNSLSDAGVAALTARTAAIGAFYNVCINLQSIEDKQFKEEVLQKARKIVKQAVELADELDKIVQEKLLTALEQTENENA